MAERIGWTRDQLIIVLKLYCDLPFGKMHSLNPEVIRYAKLIGRTPSAVAMKLTNFASLDPAITRSGRKGLSAVSRSDRLIWNEMTSDWNQFAEEIARVEEELAGGILLPPGIEPELDSMSYVGATREATVKVRVGQQLFRSAVLSSYEYRCCVSGLALPELLVASHIVPWHIDKNNRLNPRNGLCLSAIHDRAFDLGLMSISGDLRVHLSNRLTKEVSNSCFDGAFQQFAGKEIRLPSKFPPALELLEFHRVYIFKNEV